MIQRPTYAAMTRPVPRRCVACAWAGALPRGAVRCPDCGAEFRAPEGPYRVLLCVNFEKIEKILEFLPETAKLLKVINLNNVGYLVIFCVSK